MGLLIEGEWHDKWYDTAQDGRFRREEASFRDWLTADGGPGPGGARGHRAEPGRYRLYVSLACPWAHRRSEEHTSELQSIMRISYAVFCLKKKKSTNQSSHHT